MKHFVVKYKWKILGLFLGGLAGYLYWYYIGCTSGTCPIQSNWHTSTLYGALIGYIFPSGPKKEEKESSASPNKL